MSSVLCYRLGVASLYNTFLFLFHFRWNIFGRLCHLACVFCLLVCSWRLCPLIQVCVARSVAIQICKKQVVIEMVLSLCASAVENSIGDAQFPCTEAPERHCRCLADASLMRRCLAEVSRMCRMRRCLADAPQTSHAFGPGAARAGVSPSALPPAPLPGGCGGGGGWGGGGAGCHPAAGGLGSAGYPLDRPCLPLSLAQTQTFMALAVRVVRRKGVLPHFPASFFGRAPSGPLVAPKEALRAPKGPLTL